jgi:hypothetical protein
VLPDGSEVTVQLTRAHAQQLELSVGDIVFLRPMPGTRLAATQPQPEPANAIGG